MKALKNPCRTLRSWARFLDRRLSEYGRKLNVVVNYDNFSRAPAAADRYREMVRHSTESHFASITRYSTNAFLSHQLGEHIADAHLQQRIHRSFDDAKDHLANSGQRLLTRVSGRSGES